MNFIAKNIASLTLIAVAAFSVLSTANANSALQIDNDHQMTRVSGGSMLPTLKSGETTVVFKAYPFQKIRIGDVVIIENSKGESVIHRVVRRNRGGTWVTQGDNNPYEDRETLSSQNFGGLALVDESIVRYQKYLAEMAPKRKMTDMIALADTSATTRFDGGHNL